MIEPKHPQLSVVRQCALLGLARASYYHQPEPESDENLRLMRVIDETYLAYPSFGSRQMARWLRRQGHAVNRKRVQRLMRQTALEAIHRKPNLSAALKPGLTVSAAPVGDRPPQSSLGDGHHLRADPRRLHLPVRGDRLV